MPCPRLLICTALLGLVPSAATAVPLPPTVRTPGTAFGAVTRSVNLQFWTQKQLVYYQLTNGPGLRVRFPRRAWGTWLTVSRMRELGRHYRERFPLAPPISVHDISKRGGGQLPRHFSHRDGRDVDIAIFLRSSRAGYVDATPRTLDLDRTLFVMLWLIRTCDVEFIMLDRQLQQAIHRRLAPRVPVEDLALLLQFPGKWRGAVIRHRNRHRNHLHVRFRRDDRPLEHPGTRVLCTPADRAPILRIPVE